MEIFLISSLTYMLLSFVKSLVILRSKMCHLTAREIYLNSKLYMDKKNPLEKCQNISEFICRMTGKRSFGNLPRSCLMLMQ